MTTISFDEWKKLDIRIGQIKEVNPHPNADKLYVLTVDFGSETKQVVAGIKEFYSKEELVGKKIPFIVNLEPALLRGVKSEAMLLAAAPQKDGKRQCVLLTTDKDIEVGARVE